MSIQPDISWDVATLAREKAYVRRGFWAKLRRFASRLPFAEDLLAAYYCAFDRATPRHVQAALIGALAYFVLPFDVIPDMLPVLGFTDDAAVLATALKLVAAHMRPEHREAARRYGVTTTLPIARRSASACSAGAISSSRNTWCTCALIRPCAHHCKISA
jgi:uncharacterized membrane protein YkvA (DUF1232 family)